MCIIPKLFPTAKKATKMLSRGYYTDEDARKRQIDTLKIFNDNVTEIKENSEYRLDFAANGKNMSLNVILSPEFPNEMPCIFVNPVIPHPWLAENSNQVLRKYFLYK